MTGKSSFLPIDEPDVWVDAFCEIEPKSNAERAGTDRFDFSDYDIVQQGQRLTDEYLRLYEEATK